MAKSIYMDYAATTPVDPRVVEVMSTCLSDVFGNPASAHVPGTQAHERVEHAREQVAGLLGASPKEIIWTSGATESINLAIKGVARYYQNRGRHIVTCRTEHKAVLDTFKQLEKEGFEATYLIPDSTGYLNPEQVADAIRPDTVLVSVMHVNNEIGIIQDIRAIGEICRRQSTLFHVDAAQSVGKVTIDLDSLPVDLLSFTAHKVYGPKGIGGLFLRREPRVCVEPLIHGGGHEMGNRSGTLATHQIAGLGAAFAISADEMVQDNQRVAALKNALWRGLEAIPDVSLNGRLDGISGILNVSFAGVDGESLLYSLRNIALSSGSACTSADQEPSYVLRALGLNDQLAQGSIRFSLGRFSTEAEVTQVCEGVVAQVHRLRVLAPESR